jgi:hypothetical protein
VNPSLGGFVEKHPVFHVPVGKMSHDLFFSLSIPVIRMVREDALGAIELLGERDAHERVRKSEPRQRPFEIAAREELRGEPIWPADQECEIAPILHARGEPAAELARRELRAVLVERDDVFALAQRAQELFRFRIDGLPWGTPGAARPRLDLEE